MNNENRRKHRMTIEEAIRTRHTVRSYNGTPVQGEQLQQLEKMIREADAEGSLHFQLINGKQDALAPYSIRYGRWTGVTNYIALVGKDSDDLEQRCGYYGARIMLWAQMAGLKTGFVETKCAVVPEEIDVKEGERLIPLTLCIGESEQCGGPHRLKSIEQLSDVKGEAPAWFAKGMEMAQLAPTAGNQQLFCIHWDGSQLSMTTEKGLLEGVDMGIARYLFETGAGIDHSMWH